MARFFDHFIQRFIRLRSCRGRVGLRLVRAAAADGSPEPCRGLAHPSAYGFFVRGARMTEAEYEALPTTSGRDIADEIAKAPDADYVMSSEFIYACYRRDEAAMTRAFRERLTTFFGEAAQSVLIAGITRHLRSSYAQGIKAQTLHRTVRFRGVSRRAKRSEDGLELPRHLSVWETRLRPAYALAPSGSLHPD